jgi:hypothetical protein
MSLNQFLKPVLGEVPNIAHQNEVEVLRDLPPETAFFALKEADTDLLLWFLENAEIEQVQGIIDLDCWKGDSFQPERFLSFFHYMCRCTPEKLHEYMKDLDPEIIVRTLLEFVDVLDFNAQEPPDVDENHLILSPDNLYALILKSENPNLRESLFHWLNKLSAMDLQLMRRHLESCKWEQKTEIEEFAYTIKKGRLEDMGFLDSSEAVLLFSRGDAPSFKKQLLENPLPAKAKEESFQALEHIEGAFVPELLREPLSESVIFAEALKKIQNPALKEVILMEALRSMNITVMADDLIHEELDVIREATSRSRRYLDLGLFYLSDASIEKASEILVRQSLHSCTRLGWLLVHDLVKAAKVIRDNFPLAFWNTRDRELLESLQGRHPELSGMMLKDLQLASTDLVSLDAVLKTAERLNQISGLGNFFKEKFRESLALDTQEFAPSETVLARLMTALARQASTKTFDPKPLSESEWEAVTQLDLEKDLRPLIKLVVDNASPQAKALLEKRLDENFSELKNYLNQKQSFPDLRFFKALHVASSAS